MPRDRIVRRLWRTEFGWRQAGTNARRVTTAHSQVDRNRPSRPDRLRADRSVEVFPTKESSSPRKTRLLGRGAAAVAQVQKRWANKREANARALRGKRVLVIAPDELCLAACSCGGWNGLGCKVLKARTGTEGLSWPLSGKPRDHSVVGTPCCRTFSAADLYNSTAAGPFFR